MALQIQKKKSIWDTIGGDISGAAGAVGGFLGGAAKGIASGVVNTAALVPDAVRWGAGELTGNQDAANNAATSFDQHGQKSLLAEPARFLNTAGAGLQGVADIGNAVLAKGVGSITQGGDAAYQAALSKANQDLSRNLQPHSGGIFNEGSNFNGPNDPALNGNEGAAVTKMVTTGAKLAPYAVGGVGGGVEGGIADAGIGGTAKAVAVQAGKSAAVNTATGAGASAAQQYEDTGKINASQVASDAAQNGLVGGVMTGAGSLLRSMRPGAPAENPSLVTNNKTIVRPSDQSAVQVAEDVKTANSPQQMPLTSLTSYEGAPDRAAVDAYKAHIQNGGQIEPLKVAQDSTGNLGIEDGKHRFQALRELGQTTAPVEMLPSTQDVVANSGKAVVRSTPPPAIDLTPSDIAMGRALGMTDDQIREAKSGTAQAVHDEVNPKGAPIKSGTDGMTPEQIKAAEDAIRTHGNDGNPTSVRLPKVQEADHSQAVLNRNFIQGKYNEFSDKVAKASKGMTENDTKLLEEYPTGKTIDELSSRAENPKQVREVLGLMKQGYDFRQAADTHFSQAGLQKGVPYRGNYQPLMVDMSHPESAAKMASIDPEYSPGYANPRNIPDYATLDALGIARKNANVLADFHDAMGMAAGAHGRLALTKGLQEAYPGQVGIGEIPRDLADNGKPYTQLKINGGQTLSLPKDIADKINARAPYEYQDGTRGAMLKRYDSANAGLKYLELGGGFFHGFTEALNFLGQTVADPKNAILHPLETTRGVARVISSIVSPRVANKAMQGFTDRGVMDNANLAGLKIMPKEILGDVNVSAVDRLKAGNPIKMIHDSVFQREIPMAKLTMFEKATKGLDPNVPEDVMKMRQAATAINHVYGGLDRSVDGMTPQTAKILSRAVLATDFTEAKFRTMQDALTKGGVQGKLARQAVIGKTLVAAVPGLVALGAAGQLKTPDQIGQAIIDQIIDPNVRTDFKTKGGIPKTAKLPATFVSEFTRIIKPIFDEGQPDKLAGIKDYASGRLAALPQKAEALVTNRDHFGNPIIVGNAGKTAANLASLVAPIPVSQGVKVASKQQSGAEAALNTLGFKVTADTNNPVMRGMAYQTSIVNGLDNQTKQQWLKIHGKLTDDNGNPVTTILPTDSGDKASAYLANPKLVEADKKINDFRISQGQPGDPFFKLSPDQQKAALKITELNSYDPQNASAAEMKRQQASWYKPYVAERGNYFDSIKQNMAASGNTSSKTDVIPYPNVDSNLSPKLDAYGQITDSTLKHQFLLNNPDVSDYFSQYDQAVRANRAYQGLPQFDKYPTASPQMQKALDYYNTLPKGTGARSAFIRANPGISDFFGQVAQYSAEQDAKRTQFEGEQPVAKVGTGSGGSGGSGSRYSSLTSYKHLGSRSANYDPYLAQNKFDGVIVGKPSFPSGDQGFDHVKGVTVKPRTPSSLRATVRTTAPKIAGGSKKLTVKSRRG